MLAFLQKLATAPIVKDLLVPAVSTAVYKFLNGLAKSLEMTLAKKSVKACKVAEDCRAASKKIQDAMARRD